MNQEHLFNFDNDLVKYTTREVLKYINESNSNKILYHYNRMTANEITQEVLLKVFKSNQGKVNKAYIRKAIRFVCIDQYRKQRDLDLNVVVGSDNYDEDEDVTVDKHLDNDPNEPDPLFKLISLTDNLKYLTPVEKEIYLKALGGDKGKDIYEELGIPHRSFYNILNKIKEKQII